ncbi:MAG: ABC transporter ATP-binding protein, partial [Spirochaetales bacterium]|nr:ABC transporter ATP-binding protein [Spirochaetales bacterium]
NQKKGLSFKEQREFEQLTQAIEDLETQKQELEDFFSSGHVDSDGSRQKRYKEVTENLDSSYLRWEELAERAEA